MAANDSTVSISEMFCQRCGDRYPPGTIRCNSDQEDLLPVGTGKDRSGSILKGKYVLVRQLGEGSFGVVYQATHLLARSDVAIKILREERQDDPSSRKLFIKEARAVMRLHTRHAVVIHDVDEADDKSLFLVMELLRGRSLDDYKTEVTGGSQRLPWLDVVRFASQICQALDEAHEAGVIHRDLKPANVMIEQTRDGKPYAKVVDFGIARLAAGPDLDTMTTETIGKIIGTPAYMSPEQCRGSTVDGRSDLYALGCMMYELLTGERPFKSGTSQGMIVAHVVETPVPPSRAFPGLSIPQELERIVMELLEKDPVKRIPSATELATRLQPFLQTGARVSATPPRRLLPWIAVAVAILAVVGGLMVWGFSGRQGASAMTEQATPASNEEVAPAQAAATHPKPEEPGGTASGDAEPEPVAARAVQEPVGPAIEPVPGPAAEPAAAPAPASAPAPEARPSAGTVRTRSSSATATGDRQDPSPSPEPGTTQARTPSSQEPATITAPAATPGASTISAQTRSPASSVPAVPDPAALAPKPAAGGSGDPVRSNANDAFDRLRRKTGKPQE